MRQNDEVIKLVCECRRAGTVQIFTGHTIDSFLKTMELVRNRPKGKVALCHIHPVKGKGRTGLFHCKNLFYGGKYQNNKFGKKYLGGGLSISNKKLKSKWAIEKDTPANDVLILVEHFLGDIIPRYLELAPVRKSKKYQLVEKILALAPGEDADSLMTYGYKTLQERLDILCHSKSTSIQNSTESKYIAYMDELTRFIGYGGDRVKMLRQIRRLLFIAYMALERQSESHTYNKYFYVKYEPLLQPQYGQARLRAPEKWSNFKDLVYNTVFSVLQGAALDTKAFKKELFSYLVFAPKPA
ncbi:hypothetical protein [Pseudomonas sp. PH1b]|uniref:hypothetical protein n=1 Tax=Pseudomonas sp. PH1b TaxID=1397282 RepID=UPI0012FEAE8E|nr:hypothetical protein [Pseudomonas sp. PH1b]